MNRAQLDYLAEGHPDPPIAGRVRIEARAWLQSDAEFSLVLEYEIQGMRKDIVSLRNELLQRKRETNA